MPIQTQFPTTFGKTYIKKFLNDRFITPASAPLSSSTTAVPGPGKLVKSADSGDNAAIASRQLQIGSVVGDLDPAYYWTKNNDNGLTRQNGLALGFYVAGTDTTDTGWLGWSSSSTPSTANLKYGIKGRAPYGAVTPGTNYAIPRGDLRYVLLLHSTGSKLYYKHGDDYYLGHVFGAGTDDPLWPMLLGSIGNYSDIRVFKVTGSTWTDPYGIVTSRLAGSISVDQTFTHEDQFLLKVDFDDTGTGASGTEISFARQDSSNYWYVNVAFSTLQLFRVVAGAPTLWGQATSAIFDGDILTIARRSDVQQGWTFTISVNEESKITRVYESLYNTSTDGKIIQIGSGASISDLECYPISLSTQPVFDEHLSGSSVFGVIGDSKSDVDRWRDLIVVGLERETHNNWTLTFSAAVAGRTVATAKADIDTAISGFSGVAPSVVLSNFGANDVSNMPTENDYKTNYLYICDAINTEFNCDIYIANAWRRSYSSQCNTLATWNADIIAQRSFLYAGHDERTWLEGGDDGVTYTSDGTHYHADNGNIECSRQWLTALGY